MSITEAKHRNRLGRFILISNLGFAGLIVVFYLLSGFDSDEFVALMKLLAPIKAVYLTAFIRYVIANRTTVSSPEDAPSQSLNPLFASTSYIIIAVHISSLVIATSLYALLNAMEFDVLLNVIIAVETFFGVYVGLFMAAMFKVEDTNNQ